jgi:hypothetical protein
VADAAEAGRFQRKFGGRDVHPHATDHDGHQFMLAQRRRKSSTRFIAKLPGFQARIIACPRRRGGRGDGNISRRSSHQSQEGFRVAVRLGGADARNVEQLVDGFGTTTGEFAQAAIVEDDVGRHALGSRGFGTPEAQGLEQLLIGGVEGFRRRGAVVAGADSLPAASSRAARRSISACSPLSTGRAASVSRSAP